MVEDCISCGAPALMGYRGRRAVDGPLCGWCIRERILADLPRPFVAADLQWERPPVVIDLREERHRAPSLEALEAFYDDGDSSTEPQPEPRARRPRANRPLRARP